MEKYVRIVNEARGLCEVGEGTDIEFYKASGFKLMNVEKAYDGCWYLAGFAPVQPLGEAKTLKKVEINAARDNAEQGGFSYLDRVFDSDPISCQRISCAAQALSAAAAVAKNPESLSITWTCQDNSTIELSAPELVGLVVALANWSNTCHERATALKGMVEAAGTLEEVRAINWDSEIVEPGQEPELEPEPEPELEPEAEPESTLTSEINSILGDA